MRISDWSSDVCSSDLAVERPHDVGFRNLAIGKDQLCGGAAAHPHLVDLLPDRKALHALFDDEGGDAARAFARLRVDDQNIGLAAVGDPALGSVQKIAIALPLALELHRDHVRSAASFRHAARADMLSREQPGQLLPLPVVISPPWDLVSDK